MCNTIIRKVKFKVSFRTLRCKSWNKSKQKINICLHDTGFLKKNFELSIMSFTKK